MENIKNLINKQIEEKGIKELWFDNYKLDYDIKLIYVENIRRFLLNGTHANSETRRILTNINPQRLLHIIQNHYIFTRFYAYIVDNVVKFNYCAGQDYIAERRAMREIIVKEY